MSERVADALDLSADETRALARRLLANHVYDTDWLLWENVPMLSESAFTKLQDAVDALAREATAAANERDRAEGIDSMYLLEQSQ